MSRRPYLAPGIPPGAERDDVRDLESLAADLDRYRQGSGPSSEELAAAPRIDDAVLIPDLTAWRLSGRVSCHPRIADGIAATSRIYAMDLHGTWVRTYSRLWSFSIAGNQARRHRH